MNSQVKLIINRRHNCDYDDYNRIAGELHTERITIFNLWYNCAAISIAMKYSSQKTYPARNNGHHLNSIAILHHIHKYFQNWNFIGYLGLNSRNKATRSKYHNKLIKKSMTTFWNQIYRLYNTYHLISRWIIDLYLLLKQFVTRHQFYTTENQHFGAGNSTETFDLNLKKSCLTPNMNQIRIWSKSIDLVARAKLKIKIR